LKKAKDDELMKEQKKIEDAERKARGEDVKKPDEKRSNQIN
jgi:hypothetical protein